MIFLLADFFSQLEQSISAFYNTIISIFKVVLLSRKVNLPKVAGGNCVVLGNGPSLNKTLETAQQELHHTALFCVNHFCLSAQFKILKPQNYVFLDLNFFSDKGHERDPNVTKTLGTLTNDTTWPLNLFIPTLARRSKSLLVLAKSNPNITIRLYNYTLAKGYKSICHALYRHQLAMPQCQNVLGACIYLALTIGYKEIYVAGADHSWAQSLEVGSDNQLYLRHRHFYNDDNHQPVLLPVYKSQLSHEKMPLHEFFVACAKTFKVYNVLEDYSRTLGSRVYNITPGSCIDAFERKSLATK